MHERIRDRYWRIWHQGRADRPRHRRTPAGEGEDQDTAARHARGYRPDGGRGGLRGGLEKELDTQVTVVNDGDAAGLAEMRWGAGKDQDGVVLMLTLGTGIGTSLFVDGRLVPNTEFGHIEVRGKDSEHRASDSSRKRDDLSWKEYAKRLDEYLHRIEFLLWPDLIVIGGGISKKSEKFFPHLTARTRVVAAEMHNNAGIAGAALAGIPERAAVKTAEQ